MALCGLGVAIILLLAVETLPRPLWYDQTLFLMAARDLSQGAVLYRDFWDIKPPGIFLFYLAGGELFGFDFIGVRLFELVWMIGFGAVAVTGLSPALGRRAAWLGSILALGFYYLQSPEFWWANVEGLAGLLILVSLIGFLRASHGGRRWFFIAGLGAGLLLTFKLTLVLIPMSFLLLLRRESWSVRSFLWLIAGLCAPAIAVCAWFAARGAVHEMIYAVWFAPLHLAGTSNPWSRLGIFKQGLRTFVGKAAPMIILAPIGAWFGWRRPAARKLTLGLILWIASGIMEVLSQVNSWWSFHWLLIAWPAAILGGIGIDAGVANSNPRIARIAPVVVFLIVVGLWYPALVHTGRELPSSIHALANAQDQPAFWAAISTDWRVVRAEADFLSRPEAQPGPVFVYLQPAIYWLSGRKPASGIHGTLDLNITPQMVTRIEDDLDRTQPVYIYLPDFARESLLRRASRLASLLERRYRPVRGVAGVWYEIQNHQR